MAKEATKDVEMAEAEPPKTEDGEEKKVLGKKEIDLMTLDGKSSVLLTRINKLDPKTIFYSNRVVYLLLFVFVIAFRSCMQ